MKTKNIFALILLVIYLGAVVYCCFGNFSGLPNVASDIFLGIPMDKIVHFIMFFPFPILSHLAFFGRIRKPSEAVLSVSAVFLAGCAIAAGTEIGQSFTDYRSCDMYDFMADSLSLAVSSIIMLAAEIHIIKHGKQIWSKES